MMRTMILLNIVVTTLTWTATTAFTPFFSAVAPDSSMAAIEGKRGKSTAPPRIRHDYSHEHNIREGRNEGVDPPSPRDDGLPVFNLFVRAHRRQVSSHNSTDQ